MAADRGVARDAARAALVGAAQGGDPEAFRALVEPLLPGAVAAVTLVTGSRADAEDAVQEALPSAWRELPQLKHLAAVNSWFRRQVVRAGWRRPRWRKRHVSLDPWAHASTDANLDRAVEQRDLERAFLALSQADRELLVMHHYWRLPIAETAALLGVPDGTVKSRVHHAMARLRAAYDAEARR